MTTLASAGASGGHRLALQRLSYRSECLVGLDALGPAALGHVRPPAAALAADRLDRLADQLDVVAPAGEVVGDADGDGGAALIDRDHLRHARADALLRLVDEPAQALRIHPFEDLADEAVPSDL